METPVCKCKASTMVSWQNPPACFIVGSSPGWGFDMFWVLTHAHQNWWERIESQHLFLRFPIFSPFFLVRSGRRLVWHACRLDLCQSMCHPVPNSWSVCQHRLGKARGPPATAAGTAGPGREPIFALYRPKKGSVTLAGGCGPPKLEGEQGEWQNSGTKRRDSNWENLACMKWCVDQLLQRTCNISGSPEMKGKGQRKGKATAAHCSVDFCCYLMCWSVTDAGVLTNSWPVPFFSRPMENGVLAKDMATTRVVTTRVTTRVRTTAAKALTPAKSQIGTGEVGTPTSTSSGWDLRGPRGPEEALAMDDEACSQGELWELLRLRMAAVAWDSDQFHESIDWNQDITPRVANVDLRRLYVDRLLADLCDRLLVRCWGAWDNRCPRFRARVSRVCTGRVFHWNGTALAFGIRESAHFGVWICSHITIKRYSTYNLSFLQEKPPESE